MIWRHDDGAMATNLVKIFSLTEPDSCALGSIGQFLSVEHELSAGAERIMRSFGPAHPAARSARPNRGSGARPHGRAARRMQTVNERRAPSTGASG